MHDRAQKRGYEEEFDVQAIAREFGENDYMKVLNAGKILEKRGFVIANFDAGQGIHAWLTGEGSLAVEQGGLTGIIHEFRRSPANFLVMDHSTHIHGSSQNIAINSQLGSQSITSSTSALSPEVADLLDRIAMQLREATRVSETDRQALLNDLLTLRSELQRPTRRWGVIGDLLDSLANVAEISGLVMQLTGWLPR
jgi:hypothetical protein